MGTCPCIDRRQLLTVGQFGSVWVDGKFVGDTDSTSNGKTPRKPSPSRSRDSSPHAPDLFEELRLARQGGQPAAQDPQGLL